MVRMKGVGNEDWWKRERLGRWLGRWRERWRDRGGREKGWRGRGVCWILVGCSREGWSRRLRRR